MTDDRRMTTDRFYGGVSNRLSNLRAMLEYINRNNPARSQLNSWVISNTEAGSEDAVSHHLTFLESIELIELSEQGCELAEYGKRWLDKQSSRTLYEALSSGVKGFDTLIQALEEGPMTDEEIMELLVSEFEEAEMTTPGPAIRHREWLQVLEYVNRDGEVNRLTSKGRDLVETRHSENSGSTERPDIGETITTEIDRISSGNGVLEFEDGPINIGPVTEDAIGEEITAKIVGNVYAVCQTPDVVAENYWSEYGGLVDPSGEDPKVVSGSVDSQDSSQSSGDNKNNSQNSDLVNLDDMGRGDTFTAEIDRISSAGNGLIKAESGHINVGPVIQEAEGTEITAMMDRGVFARCMTKDVRAENYETRYGLLKTPSNPSSTVSLPPVEERSTSQMGRSTFCSRCGSLMYPSKGGSRVCSSCGYEQSDSTAENKTGTGSETTDESAEKLDDEVSDNEESSTKAQQNSKSISASERGKTTSSDPNRDTETSKLREKAVESAVEEVPQEASTKQHETPTYNRSQAVKEYVKARADGMCEGCREPAPFTSKTGKPYLHAHHIHELSDGGSDTPDTVVALCPNCHYRVHHGEDGDEYNQELLEVVQEKETSNQ